VDVSQMIKQFYATSGHSWDINIILEMNIPLGAKISSRACKITCSQYVYAVSNDLFEAATLCTGLWMLS
jgi:hypothetical protein